MAVLVAHVGPIHTLAFSPDGTRLASGGDDSVIWLWNTTTFERLLALRGHENYVHALEFSPNGTQLVSGSGDGTVRIWHSR